MSWFNKPGRLVLRSIKYDFDFLQLPHLKLSAKIGFVIKKYFSLITHPTAVSLVGRRFFFTNRAGIAFLQTVFVDNAFLADFCLSPKVVIDVGAHTGQFNFFCRIYLKADRVYSFEPIKESFETLSKNFKTNVFPWAVASSPAVNLFIPNSNSFMASVFKLSPVFTKHQVAAKRLDQIEQINNLPEIDLLKIDTEGSELDVLKTCGQILKKTKYVLVECSLDRPNNGDLTAVYRFLDENRFRVVHLGRPYPTRNNTIGAIDVLFSQK